MTAQTGRENPDAESAFPRLEKGGKKKTPAFEDSVLMDLAEGAVESISVEEGAPAWALTFGDMMSLLLVFFILLFSISEVKIAKFQQATQSIRMGFGQSITQAMTTQTSGLLTSEYTDNIRDRDIDWRLFEITQKLMDFISENSLKSTFDVVDNSSGISLLIQDAVLFQEASAEISPENRWIIDRICKLVIEISIPVVISGHTDSLAIHTETYPSNWELSSARASRVARELIEQGFSGADIHIEGYAEFKPVSTNETIEGRAANRRVELLYTRQKVREKLVDEVNKEYEEGSYR